MGTNKITFITPATFTLNGGISLEHNYSQEFQLLDGSSISLASSIGQRDNQQDCVAVTKNEDYILLLVADGAGGMSFGEEASYCTAKIIKKWIDTEDKEQLKTLNERNLEDALHALMYLISNKIPNNSHTTLSMSIICPDRTLIVNIGDSRTYTIKDSEITLRTKDDSLVFEKHHPQTAEDRDKLRFHKKNNIILNSISKDTFPNIKITTIKNEDYDVIIHVTDGVTDYLAEKEICNNIRKQLSASSLVFSAGDGEPIYNDDYSSEFNSCIYSGQDNASTVMYVKKRKRTS